MQYLLTDNIAAAATLSLESQFMDNRAFYQDGSYDIVASIMSPG